MPSTMQISTSPVAYTLLACWMASALLLDPELGQVLSKVGPPRHAKAIAERLKHFKQCRRLPAEEREAIALFAGAIGFTFGFMRPVVHGQNRNEAKKTAITLANIFVRSLCPAPC
jgi:hypothetical protein